MRTISILLLLLLTAACSTPTPDTSERPTLAPTAGQIQFQTGNESGTRCTEVDPHPLGVNIAQKYGVSYEKIMGWFCSGYPFDEILIALQTTAVSDRSPEELLAMRETHSWDQIWTELGIVGP